MGVQEQGAGVFSMKWGFSFSLQISGFLLHPYTAKRERKRALRPPLLMSQSHCGSSTILTSPIPNFIPKAPSPPTKILKIRVPKHKFWGNTHIQSITLLYTWSSFKTQTKCSLPFKVSSLTTSLLVSPRALPLAFYYTSLSAPSTRSLLSNI